MGAWRGKNPDGTPVSDLTHNPDGSVSSGGTPDTGFFAGFGDSSLNPNKWLSQGAGGVVDKGRGAYSWAEGKYNDATKAFTQPGKDQQKAIQGASDQTRALGAEQRDWYTGANTQAQNYYSPAQGAYNDMANNAPSQSQNAFGYLGGQLGGSTSQEQLAAGPNYSNEQGIMQGYYGSQQGSAGPSQFRDYANATQGQLSQQGVGERYAGQRLAGGIDQGALGQRYGQAQQFAQGPDAIAQRYQQQQNGPQTGMLDQYAGREMQRGIPGSTQSVFDSSNRGLSGPGASENLYNSQTYGRGPTDVEQLYSERKGGNDPAAAYQDQRATEQINNQLAARGRYNSGPGVREISDYLANANAQRSQQLAGLSEASSGAAGQRAGYMAGLAGQTDQNRLSATSLRGQLAQNADSMNLQGRNYLGGLASGVDSNQLQRQQQLNQLASNTSASGLARQNMLNGVAGGLDESRFRQQQALDNAANQSQQFQMGRLGMGADLARGSSAEAQAQQGYLANLAQHASAERAGQATFGLNAAQGADQSRLANDQLYGNLAQQASGEQSKYYGDLNKTALDLGQAQAGTMGQFYGAAGSQYTQAQMAAIEAEMKAKGMDTSVLGQAGRYGGQVFGKGG